MTIDAVATIGTGQFNASTNDTFDLSCGSVSATNPAEGTLTGTEADIIPSTTIDTNSGATLANDWHAALAASAQFDGTSSALDLYVNAAVTDACSKAAVTIAITGTLTITWINLGDY